MAASALTSDAFARMDDDAQDEIQKRCLHHGFLPVMLTIAGSRFNGMIVRANNDSFALLARSSDATGYPMLVREHMFGTRFVVRSPRGAAKCGEKLEYWLWRDLEMSPSFPTNDRFVKTLKGGVLAEETMDITSAMPIVCFPLLLTLEIHLTWHVIFSRPFDKDKIINTVTLFFRR